MKKRLIIFLTVAVFLILTGIVLAWAGSMGITERVSISTYGEQGNGSSWNPSISADGRFVAFESWASNLLNDGVRGNQIFVRDRVYGKTSRVSISSTGMPANNSSYSPFISANGRYVAFESLASNLITGDSNGCADVFVHDLQTGETTRVSISSSGIQANGRSSHPSVSADGRYVAFMSAATNLVAGDSNGKTDIFVHDRVTGQTKRVSVSGSGVQGNNASSYPSISSDGRYVAFESGASNLVEGDTNNVWDIFVHDSVTGETKRVNVSNTGVQGDDGSWYPAISGDGRYVAFCSSATNLVDGDTNGWDDIFVHDCVYGETKLVSISSAGQQGDYVSYDPVSISVDGRYITFCSEAGNLVDGDTNNESDIFVHDCVTGETKRVSVSSTGEEANSWSWWSSISADGRYIAFDSGASNLVDGDTNARTDVFVYDCGEMEPEPELAVVFTAELNYERGSQTNVPNPFHLLVTVHNEGKGTAENAKLQLTLPSGLYLKGNQQSTISLGDLTRYQEVVKSWDICATPSHDITYNKTITVAVSYEKNGQTLTSIQSKTINVLPAKYPIVILPGILGSWSTDILKIYDPKYSGSWKPGFILSDNSFTNPLKPIVDALKEKGYTENINIFVVPYDWRKSNADTVKNFLVPALNSARNQFISTYGLSTDANVDIDVISHSMGGLVARYYLEKYDQVNGVKIRNLFLLGTPNYGSPKAYPFWEGGVTIGNGTIDPSLPVLNSLMV